MSDFRAVEKGTLKLVIKLKDGSEITEVADGPASSGIFRFKVSPEKTGDAEMILHYVGQGIEDTITAGPCRLFATEKNAAEALHEDEEPGGIAYTKEQQWKTDFAIAEVRTHPLQPSVQAIGDIQPVAGHSARISAPTRGRFTIGKEIPSPGMKVTAGQVLGTVSPYLAEGGDRSSLEADAQSAKAEYLSAKTQLERLEKLFAEKAVPERRVEEARTEMEIANAKQKAANGRLRQYTRSASGMAGKGTGGFQIRSPLDGTLVEISVASGDNVEEGQALFRVIDLSAVWLSAKVFEPDIPRVENAKAAWFELEGYDTPFTIDDTNGKLVTIGQVVDAHSRTVPVIFEMANPDGRLRIGQFATVFIATGDVRESLAIPETALLNEGGKQVAYVMAEGERFERRVVRTGMGHKGLVEVLDGVKRGERVVTVGAYEIRLAAASGAIPEHGHVH